MVHKLLLLSCDFAWLGQNCTDHALEILRSIAAVVLLPPLITGDVWCQSANCEAWESAGGLWDGARRAFFAIGCATCSQTMRLWQVYNFGPQLSRVS